MGDDNTQNQLDEIQEDTTSMEEKIEAIDAVVKQPETTKTGFQLHPENINRNGRPKRGWAWNELIEDAVNEVVKNQAGEELEVKKLVVKRLVKMASEGDLQAIREIINRMDGMPVQPNAQIPEDQIDDYLHIYKPVKNEK